MHSVNSVHMSIPIFKFVPPPLLSINLFSLCLHFCFANRTIYSIFQHIFVNTWYLFFSFWLSSLCMTVSRSIHVTANDIILFLLWLNNIPLYIYITSSLFIHLLMDIWVASVSCCYCKQCCDEHWGILKWNGQKICMGFGVPLMCGFTSREQFLAHSPVCPHPVTSATFCPSRVWAYRGWDP